MDDAIEISFDEVITYCNRLLAQVRAGKELQDPEIIVLEGAWAKEEYSDLSKRSRFGHKYLQTFVAPRLWRELSALLGVRIRKYNIKDIIEHRIRVEKGILPDIEMEKREVQTQPALKSPETSLSLEKLLRAWKPQTTRLIGQPSNVESFIGRQDDIAWLQQTLTRNRCVLISGAPGIGKTWLISQVLKESSWQTQEYAFALWHSCTSNQSLAEIYTVLMQQIAEEAKCPQLREVGLLELLKYKKVLLILDGIDAVLQREPKTLDDLVQLVAEQSSSTLVITSRAWIESGKRLQGLGRPVESRKLEGLSLDDAKQLLSRYRLSDQQLWSRLVEIYQGNPHLLILYAEKVESYLGGKLSLLFDHSASFAGDYFEDYKCDQLFEGLAELDQQILNCLSVAESTAAISVSDLLVLLKREARVSVSLMNVIKAVEHLEGLSLLNVGRSVQDQVPLISIPVSVKKYLCRRMQVV